MVWSWCVEVKTSAGLVYLTLWLCARFSLSIPFLEKALFHKHRHRRQDNSLYSDLDIYIKGRFGRCPFFAGTRAFDSIDCQTGVFASACDPNAIELNTPCSLLFLPHGNPPRAATPTYNLPIHPKIDSRHGCSVFYPRPMVVGLDDRPTAFSGHPSSIDPVNKI